MLAVIHNPEAIHRVLWLQVPSQHRATEFLPFLSESNLLAMFPGAEWQGRASAGNRLTYTAEQMTPAQVAALGNRLFENAFPETATP